MSKLDKTTKQIFDNAFERGWLETEDIPGPAFRLKTIRLRYYPFSDRSGEKYRYWLNITNKERSMT